MCGLLDKKIINSLHARGLVYFDVPISDDDYFYGKNFNIKKNLKFKNFSSKIGWLHYE